VLFSIRAGYWLERQLRGKPVGMRTSALICIGTYVFVAITRHVATDVTDPSRIIGQVVTGIGFLGAGVILARQGAIIGVTSASAIWVLAAIGAVIGVGYCWLGVKLAILTVLILAGVDSVENRVEALQKAYMAASGRSTTGRKASNPDEGNLRINLSLGPPTMLHDQSSAARTTPCPSCDGSYRPGLRDARYSHPFSDAPAWKCSVRVNC